MKIKKKLIITIIIIFLTGTITPMSLFINNSLILSRIYYKINYGANVQNFESIIEKSELFEYERYVKYYAYRKGDVQNLSRSDYHHYIDREYIESLKLKIEADKQKFHLFPAYQRNFVYSVEVTNESLIYLNYNNKAVIRAEYADRTEIFRASMAFWEPNSPHWTGVWYLNFTQIPSTPNYNATIILSNIFLVKLNLKYNQVIGLGSSSYLTIEQSLFFNSDFQVIFVTIDAAEAVQ